MKVAPAIVSVPLRLLVDVLAAMLKFTLPDPVPEPPLVIVIHAALLAALQPHAAPAVTVLAPVPPAAVNVRLVGEML